MTTKETTPVVWDGREGEIDASMFDTWDEAAEEAAFQHAARVMDVRYIIVEGRTFAGRFPDGTIVKAPLSISVDDLDALTAEHDNPVDQVKALLERIGDADGAKALGAQNLTSVVIYANRFFDVFQRVAQASMGKSSGS
jgi:hypothetical protein